MQIATIDTGNSATNVIPARLKASFNIRFNANHTAESLMQILRGKAQSALEGTGLEHQIEFLPASACFVTEPGPLVDLMVGAVKDYCPVIEFGLVNETIHQVDERVETEDLDILTGIYGTFLERYFSA